MSAKETIVEGAWGSRLHNIFNVHSGLSDLSDLTVRKGFRGISVAATGNLIMRRAALRNNGTETTPDGGGLYLSGPTSLINVDVTGNKGSVGGGIYSSAALDMKKSLIENNQGADGAGIFAGSETHITDSTLRANTATNIGGGIFSQGYLDLRGSTLEQNKADSGGGIFAFFRFDITDSRLLGNTAQSQGGGLFDWSWKRGDIVRTLIKNNKAKGNGGGIYKEEGPISTCKNLLLQRVTLVDNHADSDHLNNEGGGGIYARCDVGGAVFFANSVINGNTGFNGGGMFMEAGFAGIYSTFAGNRARGHGGGIFTTGGEIGGPEIVRSSFINNSAGQGGGAIASQGVRFGLAEVTISGNKAKGFGGGIDVFSNGEATLYYVTVTNNRADSDSTGGGAGGGLQNGGAAAFTVRESIVSGNSVGSSGTSPDCAGAFTSDKFNIIGKKSGCTGFSGPEDEIGGDAGFLPLAWNGGPTRTHALKPSSPAIDFGRFPQPLANLDQRGALVQGRRDSGAYERSTCQGVLVTIVGSQEANRLTGTSKADGIFAGYGDDVIKGLNGNDGLCGWLGKDRLEGGDGDDELDGGDQDDNCLGGPGSDHFQSCEKVSE